jgi:hypothetical protein
MPTFKRQLELGAHTVGAAYQHRFLVALGHFEQGTKTANPGQHAFAHGLFGQRFDALDQGVTGNDVDTGVFVGEGGRSGRLGHGSVLGGCTGRPE